MIMIEATQDIDVIFFVFIRFRMDISLHCFTNKNNLLFVENKLILDKPILFKERIIVS